MKGHLEAAANRPVVSMKTSKRKRSSKSEPVVEALDSAPAAVAVVAAEPANDPVVAESQPAAEVVAPESVAAESQPAAEVMASEAVFAEASVASEAVAEPVTVVAPSAPVQAGAVDPVIVLAANCSVKDAASLKTSLCAVANESGAVTLDTSAVERVDTATMQLLCAFVRDRGTRNQSIVWRGQSQALHDAVRLLGVGALLGFDAAGVAA
jgi:ABC-type transporter Mla MlaB component